MGLVQGGDLQHHHPAFIRIGLAFQQLLVRVGQPLVIADLAVEVGDRVQRLEVVGVHLEDALENRDRLLVVAELVADQPAQLHRARHAQRGIFGEEQLPFGHLDDARPVLVGLVVGPQPLVGDDVARIDLGDQLFERERRGVGVMQLLLEDLGALQADVGGAAGLGERHLALHDAHERDPVGLAVEDAGQRLERLHVGGQQIEQRLPGVARPSQVAQLALDQPRQLAQVLRLLRRIGDDALDLEVEDPRQVLPLVQGGVDLDQRAERLAVVRVEAHDLLEPARRAARVLQRAAHDVGDAAQDRQLLVWVGRVFGVLIEHAHQLLRVAGAFEDPFQARECVPIARHRRQDLVRRPLPLREVPGPFVADHQHPAQQPDALLLGRGALDLLAQQRRQAHEVALALVGLDDGAHRHRVGRIGPEDVLVDLDRARRLAQLLAVDLRGAPQDLGARSRVRRRGRFPLEQRRQPVPALALEQQAPLRLPRAAVRRGDLLGALPRRDGALGVAQLLLADRGDLLQPGQELVVTDARQPRALEGELEQIGQRRPVPLLAEVFGVSAEGQLVLGLDLQHRVQVDSGLIAIAQPIAVQRGQLQHRARPLLGIRHRAKLALAQLGQLGVLLARQVQLDKLLARGPTRRLDQRNLVVHALRLGDVVELSLRELRALVEVVDALGFDRRDPDTFPVEAIELLEPPRVVVDPLEQLGRLRVRGDGAQRPAQRRDRVFGVARLLAAARDLIVDGGCAVDAVGADPVRVGVDAGQQLQRLLVARAQADHLGQPLRGGVQLLQLLAQHPPEAQQQIGAPARVLRPFQLQLVQAHDSPVVAQRPVDSCARTRSTGRAPAPAFPSSAGCGRRAPGARNGSGTAGSSPLPARRCAPDRGCARRRPPPSPASSCSRRSAPARDRCP
jgi:hypothetical protein